MPKQRKNHSRSKRRVSRKRTRRTRRTRRTKRRTRRTRRTRRIRGGSGVDGKGSPETYEEWGNLVGFPQEEELDDEAVAPDELVPPKQLEMAGLPLAQQTSVPVYGAPPEGVDDEAGKFLGRGRWNVDSSTAPPVPSFVAPPVPSLAAPPVPVPSFDMPSASDMEHFIRTSSTMVLRRALGIRHKQFKKTKLQKKARRPKNQELIGKAVISTQKYKGSHKGNK